MTLHIVRGMPPPRRSCRRLGGFWSRLWLERLESRDVPSNVVTPFTPRFSRNDTGDIAIIGNTLLTAPAGAAGDAARNGTGALLNNNDFSMVNVDVDSDASTLNSSRATLNMPAGATVLFAGLYWGADSANATRNQVKFQTPIAGAYVSLTGSVVGATGGDYSAFVDVTPLVQIAGNGVYTVADVQATVNQVDKQAGWGLVVVYRDPTAVPRNLTVFDGFVVVNTTAPSTISTSINGFVTPLAGAVNAKVGFITYEGDLGFTGDFCQLNGTTLTDAQHPPDNFFNSKISEVGVQQAGRTPSYVNQMGFDATRVDGSGIIPNNSNSATVTVGTTQETYYPSVITTSIDIYAPEFVSPKTLVDLNGGNIEPGDILEYTINVQNIGGDHATQSVLTDPIPSYTTYVPGSLSILTGANVGAKSDGAGDDQAEFDAVNNLVRFRLGAGANAVTGGNLNLGTSSSVRFRVQVNAGTPNNTTINNQAIASGKGATVGLVVSSASTTAAAVVLGGQAGLHLEMAVSDSRPNVGDTITFTVQLTNNGPTNANGVAVSDPLPAGLTFVSASGTGSYNSGTGNWTVGSMLVGDVATLTITAVVASPNSSLNVATITASSVVDSDLGDNTASAPVTPQRADLGVFASIDDPTPTLGQIITYTIALTNYGADPASGIIVNDPLPAGMAFVSATTLNGSYDPLTGNWIVGALDRPGTVYLIIRAQATSITPGTDIATITAAKQYDPNPSNNSSSATLSPALADLSLVKTVNDATPTANETITFTVTVTNSGPAQATNVKVSELIPAGMSFVSAAVTQGSYSSANSVWTVGTLNSGQSRILTLQVKVIDPSPSANGATVSSDQFDPDPGDNIATASVTPQTADIDLEKQISASSAVIGDTIAYSIRVTNRGPNNTTGVYVDDVLPAGVTFGSAIPSQGSYNSGTGRWTVGNLAVGAEAVVLLIATVNNPAIITNVATGGSDQFDTIPNNNTAQSVVTPTTANLSLVKTVNSPTPNIGDVVTYTVTLSNAGPDVATDPVVYDPLPPGLQFVSASATAGTYDVDNGRWQLPNFLSGATATLTLQALVVGPGATLYTARASATEFDPDTSNNVATAAITPGGNLGGSVYLDLNGDGLRGVGEPGVAGVTVQLRNAGNAVIATATTDAAGVYTIIGVVPGTYSLVEIQPAGYTDGLDAAGSAGGTVGNDTISNVPIAAGVRLTGYTFGESTTAPTITITNASATEGSPVPFPINLSGPSATPIVLNLSTAGGTATSGTDYSPSNFEFSLDGGTTWLPGGGASGTEVTIPAGSTTIFARVATVSDTIDEPNETFNLSGSVVVGSAAAVNSGTGTILDDDPAPTVTIQDTSGNEGSLLVFTLQLSNASSTNIVLIMSASGGTATAGSDYQNTNFDFSTNGGVSWSPGVGPGGTRVTIPAGSTSILVRVTSLQDTIDEPDETFTLSGALFSGSITGVNSGTGTIIDDDPAPTVTISNGSGAEGSPVVFTMSLSNASSSGIVIDLTATDVTAITGVDYSNVNFEYSTNAGASWLPGGGPNGTQVTVPALATSILARVATIADTIDEPNETFTLSGAIVSGSVTAINPGTGTIIDDDPAPTVTIANGSAIEGNPVVFNVTLSNASASVIVINLAAAAGTATAGSDYLDLSFEYSIDGGLNWLPGAGPNGTQVTVPALATAIQARVITISDTVDEPNETFNLSGSAISGVVTAINPGTGTIINDDPAPTITINPGSGIEGNPIVFTLSFSNASSLPIVLDLTASGGTATAATDYSDINFEYSTNGGTTWLPAANPNGRRITIPAGATSIQVRVASISDAVAEPNETFNLSGVTVSGSVTAVNAGVGTIIDDDPAPTVTINSGSGTEGTPVIFSLTLSNPSNTPTVLDLSTADITATTGSDYTPLNFEYSIDGGTTWLPGGGPNSTQVTIPANKAGILVRVATLQDTIDEPNETFTLSGSAVSGVVGTINPGTGTIIDDDPAPTVTIANGSGTEGTPIVFAINLSNPSSSAIVLDLTASGGTSTAGSDYSPNNFEFSIDGGTNWLPGGGPNATQVTVPANSAGILVRVTTISDTTDEPNETFNLAGVTISGFVASINPGVGTIIDDDPAPTITINPGSATEGSPVVFTLSLSNASSLPIVLDLNASGGTATAASDYSDINFEYSTDGGTTWLPGANPNGRPVTIPANSTSLLVRVATIADLIAEPNETFNLSGVTFSGSVTAINPGVGTIIDDDPAPTVTINAGTSTEGTPIVFSLSLSNPSSTPTVLDLTVTDNTATAGLDYTNTSFGYSIDGGASWLPGGGPSGTQVTIPAASAGILVRVTTLDDTIDEPNETFTLSGSAISGVVGTINSGTGTIIDDDPAPTVTIANGSATEGSPLVFSISMSNPSSNNIVLDLTGTSGTATAGVDFTTTNFEYSIDGRANWLSGTGPTGTQVILPALGTSILVRVATIQDNIDEPNETFTLSGSAVSGAITAINSGTGTIVDDDPAPAITIGNGSVKEGGLIVFSISLTNPSWSPIVLDLTAFGGTATAGVDYQAANFEFSIDGGTTWLPAIGPNGTQVTIPAGGTSILTRIATIQDTITETNETFTLSANVISGAALVGNPAQGTIIDDDPPSSSVAGSVYIDLNQNGVRDANEQGIGGVPIHLMGTDDKGRPISRTIVTNPSGTFIFTAIRPGNYTLSDAQPAPLAGAAVVGTQGGVAGTNEISFSLVSGVFGTGNMFSRAQLSDPLASKEQLLASTPRNGGVLAGFNPSSMAQSPTFANSVAATTLAPTTPPRYVATGAGPGGGPHVRVFDFGSGVERFNFFAYDASFYGGVRVAVGDVNGDGTPDLITGPGPGGGPHVRVFDGATGAVILEFMAFMPTFYGGIYVAAGDINGDGRAEIIVGAGEGGGPHVRVFDSTGTVVTENFVFGAGFRGGVRVAAGDVNGDGRADVMVAAGPSGGPHVRVFSAGLTNVIHEFFAYDPNFRGGVSITAGDVNGDGRADIITAPASGGSPHVKAFSGVDLSLLASFYAFTPSYTGGLNIAARDTNGDGRDDIIAAPASTLPSYVRVIDVASSSDLDAFLGYGPAFRGGVFVG
ncbi:MAG: SdrD B-like domain-containing protein [Gemmataceae bacterium]